MLRFWDAHFSVEGTLIEAWASKKSFKPKTAGGDDPPAPPASGGRNVEVDFKGQKRSNETHRRTTNPEARLYRKGAGMEARLCFIGHTLMENRSGLIVDARLTLFRQNYSQSAPNAFLRRERALR